MSRAKDCLLDTITVALYGSTKPWSQNVVQYVKALGLAGHFTALGDSRRAPAHLAALANGTMAHAFELDNGRQPGAGVHPGATAFLPALAGAEGQRDAGKGVLTA